MFSLIHSRDDGNTQQIEERGLDEVSQEIVNLTMVKICTLIVVRVHNSTQYSYNPLSYTSKIHVEVHYFSRNFSLSQNAAGGEED